MFFIDKNWITLISAKSSPAERENFLTMAQSAPGLVRGAIVFDEPRFLLNLLSLNYKNEIKISENNFRSLEILLVDLQALLTCSQFQVNVKIF